MTTLAATYSKHIRELVNQHRGLTRNGKLLLAVWYDKDNENGDVNLFEVYEEFPDPGVGKLETFMFPSSSKFPMKGSLRLTVTSPSELRDAADHNDPTLAHIMDSQDKEVIYPAGADWDAAIKGLVR